MGNKLPSTISITDAGHQEDPITCPDGTVMTGIRWKTGRGHIPNSPAINGIEGVWCKDTHRMDLPNQQSNRSYHKVMWGDTGGKSRDAECSSDAALRGGQFWFEQDNKIGGAQLYCAPFGKKNPQITKIPVVGVKTDTNRAWGWYKKGSDTNDVFLNGLGARTRHKKGKRMIWGLDLNSKDYKPVREILNDQEKQSECCSGGNTDRVSCGKFKLGSASCNKVMKSYCGKDDNIAKGKCQNFCRNDKTKECDDAMIAYCKRQKEKGESPEICNCINSSSLAPQCWDPKCSATSAYQTYNQENRDTCGTYCSQELYASAGDTVNIDKVQFIQECGNELEDPEKQLEELETIRELLKKQNPAASKEKLDELVQEYIKEKEKKAEEKEKEKEEAKEDDDIDDTDDDSGNGGFDAMSVLRRYYWILIIIAVLIIFAGVGAGVFYIVI